MSLGKKLPNARKLLHFLYSKPVITVSDVIAILNTTKQSANNLIKDFCDLGILTEQTGYKRNRIFTFTAYLKLFQE